jgi:hypothetical protein
VSSIFTGANGLNGQAVSSISSFYNIVNGTVDPAPSTPAGNELTYIRFIAQQTQAYTQAIQLAANAGNNVAVYPSNNRLADQLKIVAKLISGGMKTPVYMVNFGGFDTHDNQVDTADHKTGEHADLLFKLSEAIAAFQEDLKLQGKEDKVTGCTLTEFGRRVKSNASGGTDHGSGGPMIVFGSKVNPTIIGSSPNLPAQPRRAITYLCSTISVRYILLYLPTGLAYRNPQPLPYSMDIVRLTCLSLSMLWVLKMYLPRYRKFHWSRIILIRCVATLPYDLQPQAAWRKSCFTTKWVECFVYSTRMKCQQAPSMYR